LKLRRAVKPFGIALKLRRPPNRRCTAMPDIDSPIVRLALKAIYGTRKLLIDVTFPYTLADYGVLTVTLSGSDSLVAQNFLKSSLDPKTYSGFVTIDNLAPGRYVTESIVHSPSTAGSTAQSYTPQASSIEI
jgi:hypothetical protein